MWTSITGKRWSKGQKQMVTSCGDGSPVAESLHQRAQKCSVKGQEYKCRDYCEDEERMRDEATKQSDWARKQQMSLAVDKCPVIHRGILAGSYPSRAASWGSNKCCHKNINAQLGSGSKSMQNIRNCKKRDREQNLKKKKSSHYYGAAWNSSTTF